MAREALEVLKECEAFLEGHFLLSSGRHSGAYCQMAFLQQYPDKAAEVMAPVAEKLKELNIDVVVGPAMGGIVYAYELGRQMGKRAIFTERVDNVMTLKRFRINPGERCIIAEDVVTTGVSSLETKRVIEENGGKFNYNERGYMLTKDGNGKINGVISKLTDADGNVTYKKYEAAKGVIVSTGYHGRAQDMMMEIGVEEAMYTLRNGEEFPASSGFGGSGDGHRMLVWEGADIEPFRQADGCVLSLLDPAAGLALNTNGKRFHNEDDQCWTLGLELRWQPGRRQWKIYDKNWRKCLDTQNFSHMAIDPLNKTPWTMPGTLNNEHAAPYTNGTKMKADGTPCDGTEFYLDILGKELEAGVGDPNGISIGSYWSWPGDIRYGANTLEELAKMVYPDDEQAQANMLAEIKEYNEMCAKGEDTRYGKAATMLYPIEEGPFYAFSAAASDVGRMGQEGIITNDRLQPVIPSTGKPIEGVYLAGVIVGGRHANCYMTPMGGMNHGFDVTFGKCAAEFLTEDNQ